jgi:hypothetical protein
MKGDVRVARLVVQDGATFIGNVSMGKAALEAPSKPLEKAPEEVQPPEKVQQIEAVKLAEAVKAIQPIKAAQPVKTVQPAKSAKPVLPARATKPPDPKARRR